jgi:hypothetical protein
MNRRRRPNDSPTLRCATVGCPSFEHRTIRVGVEVVFFLCATCVGEDVYKAARSKQAALLLGST